MTDSQPRERTQSGWSRLAHADAGDILGLVWRERALGVGVAGLVALLGLGGVLMLPKSYQASARVLVLADEAYVLDTLEEARRGSTLGLSPNEMIQSERALLLAEPVRRAVLNALGAEAVAPGLEDPALGPERQAALALAAMSKRLSADVLPQSPTLRVTYKHPDAEVSANIVNRTVEAYIGYRRAVLQSVDAGALARERLDAQERLSTLNQTLSHLLDAAGVGDYEADRAAVNTQAAEAGAALLRTRAERAEAEARARTLSAQLEATPAEIALHTDDATPARLQDLLIERQELLTRYLPTSSVIKAHDEKIERLRASYGAGEVGGGLTRRGPNPVRQTLTSERDAAAADVAALRSREATLAAQVQTLRDRQRALQELAPQFAALERERAVVEASVGAVAAKEERARTRRALTQSASDSVRVIEWASAPTRGTSLRKPAFAAVLMLAFLTGVFAAALRGLTRALAVQHAKPRTQIQAPAAVDPLARPGARGAR